MDPSDARELSGASVNELLNNEMTNLTRSFTGPMGPQYAVQSMVAHGQHPGHQTDNLMPAQSGSSAGQRTQAPAGTPADKRAFGPPYTRAAATRNLTRQQLSQVQSTDVNSITPVSAAGALGHGMAQTVGDATTSVAADAHAGQQASFHSEQLGHGAMFADRSSSEQIGQSSGYGSQSISTPPGFAIADPRAPSAQAQLSAAEASPAEHHIQAQEREHAGSKQAGIFGAKTVVPSEISLAALAELMQTNVNTKHDDDKRPVKVH